MQMQVLESPPHMYALYFVSLVHVHPYMYYNMYFNMCYNMFLSYSVAKHSLTFCSLAGVVCYSAGKKYWRKPWKLKSGNWFRRTASIVPSHAVDLLPGNYTCQCNFNGSLRCRTSLWNVLLSKAFPLPLSRLCVVYPHEQWFLQYCQQFLFALCFQSEIYHTSKCERLVWDSRSTMNIECIFAADNANCWF